MKYINDFRDGKLAKGVAARIFKEVNPNQNYKFMEFCGGHTHAIHRYGIPSLLPKNISMIHGPGCPVCILPIKRIDNAIALAKLPNIIFCSYGDMLRVPGNNRNSLLKARAEGADIQMIYSAYDALVLAEKYPGKEVIFFAVGFETTTPPTAIVLKQAKEKKLKNFSVFCNHVLTPVAMNCLLKTSNGKKNADLDGFIGPAHVSIVIGSKAYEGVCNEYNKPIVISGFEPLDILYSILMLIHQLNENRCEVENQYVRAVNANGNIKSQKIIAEVLELRELFEWRGLGFIPHSALQIKKEYQYFDAEKRFSIPPSVGKEIKGCECASVLRGEKGPTECKLFANVCTPSNPLGACMVSSEGACAAVYAYGQHNN